MLPFARELVIIHSSLKQPTLGRADARSVGREASVYGYPLVEMLRMCRLQTHSRFDPVSGGAVPIDTLHHSAFPPLDGDQGFAADNRLRFTSAWICLGEGSRQLTIPPAAAREGVTTVLSFYNAYGELVAQMGGEDAKQGIVLLGPHTAAPEWVVGEQLLCCSTSLVWLVARTTADSDFEELSSAVLSAMIRLNGARGTLNGRRPAAVELWEGDATDAFAELIQREQPAVEIAPTFYANLCRAFAHTPGRIDERPLMTRFRQAGLMPAEFLSWHDLPPQIQAGLIDGFEDAAIEVSAQATRLQQNRNAALQQTARAGHGYLARAATVRAGWWPFAAVPTSSAACNWASPGRASIPRIGLRPD